MDPLTITAIVTALSSGAAVSLGGALSEAGKDAYNALKTGVRKFVAPGDLEKLERDPESKQLQALLTTQLSASDPNAIAELTPLAHRLSNEIKVEGDAAIVQATKVEGGVHQGDVHHQYALPPNLPDLVRALGETNLKAFQAGQGNQSLHNQLSGLSGKLELTESAVANMLRILGEQAVPPEQLDAKLGEIAERHKELTQRLRALSNDDPGVVALRNKAAESLETGDYDRADDFLSQAEALDERAIAEQQDSLDRRKLSAAQTLAERGELERARLNYLKAAEHFAAAAARVPDTEEEARWRHLLAQASVLYDHGREFGENPSLARAITAYKPALNLRPRDRVPLAWATTQNNLGNALATLGQRESGTARLEEAAAAFRAALEVFELAGAEHYIDMVKENLERAETLLRERRGG